MPREIRVGGRVGSSDEAIHTRWDAEPYRCLLDHPVYPVKTLGAGEGRTGWTGFAGSET